MSDLNDLLSCRVRSEGETMAAGDIILIADNFKAIGFTTAYDKYYAGQKVTNNLGGKVICKDKKINECVANNDDLLMKAEQHIQKLTCELKEKQAEKAHYIKENGFLKEALSRLIGLNR